MGEFSENLTRAKEYNEMKEIGLVLAESLEVALDGMMSMKASGMTDSELEQLRQVRALIARGRKVFG